RRVRSALLVDLLHVDPWCLRSSREAKRKRSANRKTLTSSSPRFATPDLPGSMCLAVSADTHVGSFLTFSEHSTASRGRHDGRNGGDAADANAVEIRDAPALWPRVCLLVSA